MSHPDCLVPHPRSSKSIGLKSCARSLYSGGVSVGADQYRLLKAAPLKPPLWTLAQFLTHLPIGSRRELTTGVTYLTQKEAAHVVHCQHHRLEQAMPDLMSHLIEAAGEEHCLSKYREAQGLTDGERVELSSLEHQDVREWVEELTSDPSEGAELDSAEP